MLIISLLNKGQYVSEMMQLSIKINIFPNRAQIWTLFIANNFSLRKLSYFWGEGVTRIVPFCENKMHYSDGFFLFKAMKIYTGYF